MTKTSKSKVYRPSNDVAVREIEGELIIVPLAASIGDLEDELYTLNETAKNIWDLIKTGNNVAEIISQLSSEYEDEPGEIEEDVLGIISELVKRNIIIE